MVLTAKRGQQFTVAAIATAIPVCEKWDSSCGHMYSVYVEKPHRCLCASLHSSTSHGHSTFAARETGDVGGGGDCLLFLALLALLVKVDKGRGDG